ncbi:MAG: hypothetical protein JNJ71_17890 [Rubrivivax sp.]|nr:hypothetical protein [Rubrivivax sp.]
MNATRRRLRWFVALHVGAVATLYGVAHAIGGGWAQGLPPDLQVPAARAMPARGASTAAVPPSTTELPAWATRAELSVPWEGH